MFGFAKKLVKQAEGIIAPDIEAQGPSYGFRVLHVSPGSEGFLAKIEPYFDFVIAVNGKRFDKQYYGAGDNPRGPISVENEQSPADEFEEAIRSTEERLVLEVFSAKGKTTRVVTLPNPKKEELGISVRWSQLSVADHVWHVLNVVPSSPADQAGLISHSDYIVAAEDGLLDSGGEYLLGKVVSRASPKEGVLFYVYNRDHNIVRPVRVKPSFDGKLGCGVGYGFLHALPPTRETQHPPGSTLFDDQAGEFLDSSVHAPLPIPQAPAPTASSPRVNHHKAQPKTAELNDYFNEQSEISRQIDGTSGSVGSVPPPPKA